MSFPEVLDAALALPRDEQLRLAHAILGDAGAVAPTAGGGEFLVGPFAPGAVFEVFTPFDCHEAAAELEKMLAERKGR